MNKKLLIAGLIFIVIGAGITIFGLLPKNAERQANVDNWNRLVGGAGKQVEGTVINTSSQMVTEGTRRNRTINTVYCAVYEYKVADEARTVTAVGDDCKDESTEIIKGDTGVIIYDEDNPSIAFVKSDASDAFYKDTNGSQIVAIILGLVLLVVGFIALFTGRSKAVDQSGVSEEARRADQEELARLVAKAEDEANRYK